MQTEQDVAASPPTRSREQLIVDIAHYAIVNRVETIPREFFRSEDEVELAESFTARETLLAAACVMEAVAELPETSPHVKTAAWTIADVLHLKAWVRARAPNIPRQYERRGPQRRPGTRTHRARAPARDPDEPGPPLGRHFPTAQRVA